MVANPRVNDTFGRVAIQRGPLVYAAEQLDQAGIALPDLSIRPNGPSTFEVRHDLLGGITTLKFSGQAAEKTYVEESLYQPLASISSHAKRPATLTLIPFYTVGNREPSPMEVWIPISRPEPSGAACPGTPQPRSIVLRASSELPKNLQKHVKSCISPPTGYPFKFMTRFSPGHRQTFVSTGLLCLFVCTLLQGHPAQSSEGQSTANPQQTQTPPATPPGAQGKAANAPARARRWCSRQFHGLQSWAV